MPDLFGDFGRLVLKGAGKATAYGFIRNLHHWDMLERKYSQRELLTAHFEPYNDFFSAHGG
eukprot:11166749-Karenia_brevis.AAC.1